MTDIDIDAIRQQVERYTGFAGSSQSFLAHTLAKRVPALLAKVAELTAALTERDAQLTAANRRADGLEADLRSAVTANTARANQSGELPESDKRYLAPFVAGMQAARMALVKRGWTTDAPMTTAEAVAAIDQERTTSVRLIAEQASVPSEATR